MYFATQPVEEPENLRDLVTMMELYDGEDNTIFASDWPHHDFDHPSKVHQVPFTNEVRRKVFGENALRLFNIDAKGGLTLGGSTRPRRRCARRGASAVRS
jgi:predicted TIM-barrel fold metal-dependent hydrolase